MAAVNHFNIDQGADCIIHFSLKDKRGAIDLTGYSAAMQIRRYTFSQEAVDTLTTCNGRLSIDAEAGRITATFPHDITEKYPPDTMVYDIELESDTGEITRIIEGKVRVSPEVTRVKCKRET